MLDELQSFRKLKSNYKLSTFLRSLPMYKNQKSYKLLLCIMGILFFKHLFNSLWLFLQIQFKPHSLERAEPFKYHVTLMTMQSNIFFNTI